MCSKSIPNSTTESIPHGYCLCGCGRKTTISRQNCKASGNAKGEPKRYYSRECANKHRGEIAAASRLSYPHPDLEGTACIPLPCGNVALIDAGDTSKVDGYSWYLDGDYAAATVDRKKTRLHRIIMDAPGGIQVDHINGDTLDNRNGNLRLAEHVENNRNRRVDLSRDLPKGVYQNGGKYQAQIQANGSKHYLGTFDTPEQAAKAYDDAAHELHREFARTNMPRSAVRPQEALRRARRVRSHTEVSTPHVAKTVARDVADQKGAA